MDTSPSDDPRSTSDAGKGSDPCSSDRAPSPSLEGHPDQTLEPVLGIVRANGGDVTVVNGEQLHNVSSILVPIAGGPHSGLAIDAAQALAEAHDAWIELLHVVEPNTGDERAEESDDILSAGRNRLGEFDRVDTWLLEADDVGDAIVEQTDYYDVTILGAPQCSRLREFLFGSTTSTVEQDAGNTVLTVEQAEDRSRLADWFTADD